MKMEMNSHGPRTINIFWYHVKFDFLLLDKNFLSKTCIVIFYKKTEIDFQNELFVPSSADLTFLRNGKSQRLTFFSNIRSKKLDPEAQFSVFCI